MCEARQLLDDGLRSALRTRANPALLERWLTSPAGQQDDEICRDLLELLPEGDDRRTAAVSHLRRISAEGLAR